VIAAIAGPAPSTEVERSEDFSACEVAVATTSSLNSADREIALARDLRARLGDTFTALRCGAISARQAQAIHHATLVDVCTVPSPPG
jgi:L-asparaginase II